MSSIRSMKTERSLPNQSLSSSENGENGQRLNTSNKRYLKGLEVESLIERLHPIKVGDAFYVSFSRVKTRKKSCIAGVLRLAIFVFMCVVLVAACMKCV
jgi:hypothetical protein